MKVLLINGSPKEHGDYLSGSARWGAYPNTEGLR